MPALDERLRRRVLHAQLARALDEPVHRGTVEAAATPVAIRPRQPREQLQVHLQGEPAERAVPDRGLGLAEHARLQVIRDDPEHFAAHIVPLERMDGQAIQQRRGRPDACLFVIERADAAVDDRSGRRLAQVMTDRAEHDRHLLRIREIVDALSCLVDHEQGVDPDVPLGMPRGLLCTADEGLELGKQPLDDAELERQREPDGRSRCFEQQLLDLAPEPLSGKVVERNRLAQRFGLRVDVELEARGELKRAQHAQAVLPECDGIDRAEQPPLEIPAAVERILVLAGERIPGDGVNCEVAPSRGLFQWEVRLTRHGEAAMPASGLRLAPRQRDVQTCHLVDGEALADGVDAAERFQDLLQTCGVDAKDLEVDVLRRMAHQPVAHPAADDERAAAGRADGARDRDRDVELAGAPDSTLIGLRPGPCENRSRCSGRTDRSCCARRSG